MTHNKRLRVRESCRDLLEAEKMDGETYSDVLVRILPEPTPDNRLRKGRRTSLPVNREAYDRTMALAEDGVPVREVIEHAILVYKYRTAGEAVPFDHVFNCGYPAADVDADVESPVDHQ